MKFGIGMAALGAGLMLAGAAWPMGMIPGGKKDSDAQLIKSAMSAAPKAIAGKATIMAMGADMKARTLREGTNG